MGRNYVYSDPLKVLIQYNTPAKLTAARDVWGEKGGHEIFFKTQGGTCYFLPLGLARSSMFVYMSVTGGCSRFVL